MSSFITTTLDCNIKWKTCFFLDSTANWIRTKKHQTAASTTPNYYTTSWSTSWILITNNTTWKCSMNNILLTRRCKMKLYFWQHGSHHRKYKTTLLVVSGTTGAFYKFDIEVFSSCHQTYKLTFLFLCILVKCYRCSRITLMKMMPSEWRSNNIFHTYSGCISFTIDYGGTRIARFSEKCLSG